MAIQNLKLKGRQFVLIPKREYERLVAQADRQAAQDRGDIAESRRRAKERSIPLSEVRKRLGL